ncbi:MAG: small multi-drug export protein [Candidatus Cloacimonetes bacterium]|nr:small multi-drug export protein [Candidatus Cloacimonadota bacterium]MDD2506624.1 small multi-drug export protein [Candidatus Cloacimonadota bacterium]MDD4147239.1 small multi-drug export protein [Candidatus Cloacimonadota bacterium]MDD4560243.1 small multi-drug export protein [Candidatus Cloacimonadota bacterium]
MNRSQYKVIISVVIMLLIWGSLSASSFSDNTVNWLEARGLSPRIIVLIISMLPVIELRGSIPVAILVFKLHWFEATVLSIIGNMLPMPIWLLVLEWFFNMISKIPIGARFTKWIFARTRNKGKAIEKYEALGLTIFIGIPLPGTGGWTGALAARIFGISFWKSMLYILIGVVMASLIVTPLSLMGKLAVN